MNVKSEIFWVLATILWANFLTIVGQETIDNTSITFCEGGQHFTFESLEAMTIDSRIFVEIAVSPDGELVAVATLSDIQIYDTKNYQLIYTLQEHEFNIWHNVSLAWSSDNAYLAIGTYITVMEVPSPENQVQIWNVNHQEVVNSILDVEVQQIIWSPNNESLTILGPVGQISIWNPLTGQKLAEYDTYESEELIPVAITWMNDDSLLVALAPDSGKLVLIDVNTGIFTVFDTIYNSVTGNIAWNAATETLSVNINSVYDILQWNLDSKKLFTFASSLGHVFDMAWSPDGMRLAVGTPFGLTLINQDESVRTLSYGPIPEFTRIEWLPDNNSLISITRSGIVFGWNIEQECLLGVINLFQDSNG